VTTGQNGTVEAMPPQLPVSDVTRARNAKEEKDPDSPCQESLIPTFRDVAWGNHGARHARTGGCRARQRQL